MRELEARLKKLEKYRQPIDWKESRFLTWRTPESERVRLTEEWKAQGKKVIHTYYGVLLVPVEVKGRC